MGEAGLRGGDLQCLWAWDGAGLQQDLVGPTPLQAREGKSGASAGDTRDLSKHVPSKRPTSTQGAQGSDGSMGRSAGAGEY